MKKLCSILLMLSMTVSALAIEVNIDGLWYEIVSKTNEAKVVKYKNNTTYRGDIVIPQTVEYNGESYVVTTIGSEAFYYCSLMTSIIIPNSVTVIDNMAFANCSGLKTLAIPNSVTTIGEKAFAWCNGLITVTIPNSVTSFGDNAFLYCNKLSSVTILDGLKRIGNSAFYGCYDLIDVLLPNSIEAIGDYTFYNCKSIKSIILPNNLRSIGHNAFSKCFSLNSIVMSDSLESLGNNAFAECSSLSSISIPKSLTHIGDYAFDECNSLSSVQIYDLEAWCRFHFWSYASNPLSYAHHLFLNGIEVKDLVIPESVTKIGDYLFFGCSGLTSVTIPNSITNIGYSAFSGCKGLTSITLHNGIVSTGTNAFNGCSSLTSITIPNSVKSIAQNSFAGCSGLTSIVIPESVTNIGYGAFRNCSNLTRIIIGSAVNTIYAKAFSDCPELMDVYCHAENMPHMENSGSDSFTTIFEGSYIEYATLHVPESSIPVYKTTEPWKNFKEIVKIKPEHTLLYLVDDEIYKSYKIEEESKIEVEEEPTKEGYTFSGWSEIPDSMPTHDVTITGTFTINKYLLTYKVNGEIVKSDSIVYNTVLVPEAEPTKEGYTFSGWSEIPDNMPAHDVAIIGSFIPIIYKLTYQVDGIDYNVYDIAYGSVITPEADPVKEGYTFSGWSEIPDTMPAHDVVVTGTFTINKYKLTYMIDDKVYKDTVYEYSATIIPEPIPEGNYATFEWIDLPETMPAHDVIVHASYVTGITDISMKEKIIRIYSPNGKALNKPQKGINLVLMRDGTIRKIVIK